jgi:hypothetical protein
MSTYLELDWQPRPQAIECNSERGKNRGGLRSFLLLLWAVVVVVVGIECE